MITILTGRTARFIRLQKQSKENRMEVQLMGLRRCNGEGYHDPTTYEALLNIRKEEKRRNVRTARLCIYAPLLPGIQNVIWKKQDITAVLR